MANSISRFNFCGEVSLPTRNPWIKKETIDFSGRKAEKISMNLGIKDGSNCVYVTSQDFKNSTVKTWDVDKNPIEIDWEDRLDPDVIKSVMGMRKYVVSLGERKEFITRYDMIEYLEQVLPEYKQDIVVIGTYNVRFNKGKGYESFDVTGVYAAREDDKRKFRLVADLYYDKDALDKSDVKNTGKIYMNAFMPMYIRDEKQEMMIVPPSNLVFNTNAYDMENPKHKAQYDYKMKHLVPTKKGWYGCRWELAVFNGAEEVPFDESCLSEEQRVAIELGFNKLDDFRPRGSIYGNRLHEFRIVKPVLLDKFVNGMTKGDWTDKEFDELIYRPATPVSAEDTVEKAAASASDDDDEDELF